MHYKNKLDFITHQACASWGLACILTIVFSYADIKV